MENKIELINNMQDLKKAEDAQRPIEPVVSVQITEESADALYKLLNSIGITRMQEFGLSFEEAQLVSRIKPHLY